MSQSPQLAEPYAARPVRVSGIERHAGWTLKIYEITYNGDPLDPRLGQAALVTVRERLPSPAVTDDRYGIGFVGVHQGRGGNFVFVDWWARENELHHHVWFSDSDTPGQLRPAGPDDPIACCWDLSVICHERAAWVRHVLTRYEEPDVEGYLADRLDGRV